MGPTERQLIRKDGTVWEQRKEHDSTPDFIVVEIEGEEVVFEFDVICDGVELYREWEDTPL